MCTGDNLDTAKAIALDAGILSQADIDDGGHEYAFMTGKQFEELVVGVVSTPDKDDPENKSKVKHELKNKKKFAEI